MERAAHIAAGLIRAGWRAYGRKWSFLGFFLIAFVGSVSMLGSLDLLPNPPLARATDASAGSTLPAPLEARKAPEEPVKIAIPAINLVATIANPETADSAALDALLLKGAVRYPTSAKLGQENGNVVLFGHSSYLPIVHNLAYKTFDDIQKLKSGDSISVYSYGTVYTYQVRGVAKESAKDGVIALSVSGKVLTLATCNSFATKSDRFVVTADFVESHPLGA